MIYGPGTVLFVLARREQGAFVFTPKERIAFAAALIAAVVAIIPARIRCHCYLGPTEIHLFMPNVITEPSIDKRVKTDQPIRYGVYSEVGKLRKVLVCPPGLAHTRLTPSNCDELLFDDVLWVNNAKRDHFDFVTKMRERDIEVVEMPVLLAETVEIPSGKKWILDHQIVANEVGLGLVSEIRSFLDSLDSKALAEYLLGGLSAIDVPDKYSNEFLKMAREASGITEYLLPPLPNTLYTRDTTCWIYGGVTLNPLYWPVRREETLLMAAIYKFHPSFARCGIRSVVGQPRGELPFRDSGGRRRAAHRQRQRTDRHE